MYDSASSTCRCLRPLLFEPGHCTACGHDLELEAERGTEDRWEELWIVVETTRYRMIQEGAFDWAYVEDGLAALFDELADALVADLLATVVDGNDFARAVEDPRVHELVADSVAYGKALVESGREHSL